MYFCEICQKGTKYQSNFNRHKKSKKHLRLIKEYNEQNKQKSELEQKYKETLTTDDKDAMIKSLQETIKSQSQQHDEMMEMMKELVKKDIAITNNTNNTNNTINNNDNRTININIAGGEDFHGIMTDELSTKLIDLADIKYLVLDTYLKHMYIEKEENRNIEYNDMSRNQCKVYTGNEGWKKENINNVIERRIRASRQILPKMFKEMNDYKECEEAYIKVVRNVKDFVNNEQGTKEYKKVVKNHKQDLINIDFDDFNCKKQCIYCSKSIMKRGWLKHLKTKSHLKRMEKYNEVMEL